MERGRWTWERPAVPGYSETKLIFRPWKRPTLVGDPLTCEAWFSHTRLVRPGYRTQEKWWGCVWLCVVFFCFFAYFPVTHMAVGMHDEKKNSIPAVQKVLWKKETCVCFFLSFFHDHTFWLHFAFSSSLSHHKNTHNLTLHQLLNKHKCFGPIWSNVWVLSRDVVFCSDTNRTLRYNWTIQFVSRCDLTWGKRLRKMVE